MAKCSGCGGDLSPAAQFCSLCGRAVAPASSVTSAKESPTKRSGGPIPPATTNRKQIAALAGVAGLALLLLGGFLFWKVRAGVLSAEPTRTPDVGVLNAPSTQMPQAPVLSAPPVQAPQAPVLQAPQTAQNPMPADVVAYLRWLKQFEAARRNLEYKGLAELSIFMQKSTTGALESLMNADPTGETEPAPSKANDNPVAGIGKVIEEWGRATQLFQQNPPPDPCAPLASHYNQALTAGVARMSALQGMLTGALQSIRGSNGQTTSVSKDTLAELYKQKSTREGSVDVDTAYNNANTALDQLRSQYTAVPPDVRTFDVKSGGGDLKLPFLGL